MPELTTRAQLELRFDQWMRLVDSIIRRLSADEEYRRGVAVVLADDFTLADYEQWFQEVPE